MPKAAAPAAHPEPVADYFNRVNPDLLALLPRSARTIVEAGCGAGALGAAFKAVSPNCRYLGIEVQPDALALAGQRLDRVIGADVETVAPADCGLAPGEVDCLVFGDVLEHLKDPWVTLQRFVPWLSADGMVLACIPNIQHWSVLLGLLQGKWRYAEQGLLDITHLRFFTLEGITKLFADAGLVIHDVRSRSPNREPARQFAEAMAPALAALGIDEKRFATQTAAMQYVVRAGRQPARPLLLQTRTLKPVGGCNDVRIDLPHAFLATQPGFKTHARVMEAPVLGSEIADKIMLFQRPILTRDDLPRLREFRQAGYLLVTEFDDHPLRWPNIEKNAQLNFRGVHAVQTSTPALADFFRQFNPEVEVFPNQIDHLPPFPDLEKRSGVRLFFGALNREDDWASWMPALNRVLQKHPELHVDVVHDRKFFDALETAAKDFTPTCNYATYRRVLAQADIAFLPLADTVFNRMKSDLKFIEAASFGVVSVASPVVYGDSVEDGQTGRLFATEEGLEQALHELIAQPERRQTLARNAWEYVRRQRMLADHVGRRLAWYRSLLTRRDALDAALNDRMWQHFDELPED